ncbi:HmuY family protein [Mucilaginibacter sp. UR6-1]|uniref:HmuY family protein n=1 Tax=Mucilaginibacter sp. UR6-1 TaxID=1435643 RepID=UPI001E4EA785|nr:HmuY family protein [Mucilaginibacter sp. UR6-1]MCC8407521.1 HmuY family protein [Mucilaginibacter sp. UR6-1]
MKSNIKALHNGLYLTIGLLFFANTCLKAQDIKVVKDLQATSKVYFSIDNGTQVTGTDTASAVWDIALQRTNILVNSGTSGKGTTAAQLLKNTAFDKVTTAPADGYIEDSAQAKAVPPGTGQGWYLYDMTNHTVNPAPGRIIVVKTSSGKYAKIEVLNYYKNGDGDPGYYTFRYAFINKAN